MCNRIRLGDDSTARCSLNQSSGYLAYENVPAFEMRSGPWSRGGVGAPCSFTQQMLREWPFEAGRVQSLCPVGQLLACRAAAPTLLIEGAATYV